MKNKKKYLFIFAFILICFCAKAQQLPLYSQYVYNDYVINPAYTGLSEYSPIQASYRKQWTNFNPCPQTIALGGHTTILNKVGIGGMIFKDETGGAFSHSGIILNYSFRFSLNRNASIALGIGAQVNQYSFNTNQLALLEQNDLALQYGNQNFYVPDLSFGLQFKYKKKLNIGIAINQLLQSNLKKIDANNLHKNELKQHYAVLLNYRTTLNEHFELKPSILLKTTLVTPIQSDIGVRFEYNKKMWIGTSYRHKDAIVLLIGIKHKHLFLSYSYDVVLSQIQSVAIGSNELMIGYHLYKKQKKHLLI